MSRENAMMEFDDLEPGDMYKANGRNFVKIDCRCEYANLLDGRWHAVEIGTGVIYAAGPNNLVEPLVRRVTPEKEEKE